MVKGGCSRMLGYVQICGDSQFVVYCDMLKEKIHVFTSCKNNQVVILFEVMC